MYKIIFLLAVILLPVPVISIDIEDYKEFFETMEKNLVYEYRLCTGDTSEKSFHTLVEWKEHINQKTKSPEYKKILREFIMHTGIVKDLMPCMVLKWYLDRKTNLHNYERKINNALLIQNDKIVDSIRLFNELKNNPVTPFDFNNIPFGVSHKVFQKVYNRECKYPLFDARKYRYIEHYLINEVPFIVKFYFTFDRIYYKYEIISYLFSGNYLNNKVRTKAVILKDLMEGKIGVVNHIYRLGYFDITSDTELTYAKWIRENHSVNIILGQTGNKYYTRLTVESKKVPNYSRRSRRSNRK